MRTAICSHSKCKNLFYFCRGVVFLGSFNFKISFPGWVKEVINKINSITRVNILSLIPNGRKIMDGYSLPMAKGFGITGQDGNAPRIFLVDSDGDYQFVKTCQSDSQCGGHEVCW